jgi:hypothetical protein
MENLIYYYPKSLIYNNKYLFFDIFIKNNELILIVPIYQDFILDEKKLIIKSKTNNEPLILKESIKYIEYEGIIILKYKLLENELVSNHIINVKYDKINQDFNLDVIFNNVNILNEDICISTLFKDDYYLLETWMNYYCEKNITDIYLYYNGKIDKIKNKLKITINKIINKYSNLNINIIEWDFPYWNNTTKFKHHAQTGMLNHCLYFYAKNHYYWLNIDLDEYINYIPNINMDIYDFYLFNNRWAKLENDENLNMCINFNETKFYLGDIQSLIKNNTMNINTMHIKNKIYTLINRTKWIINTTKFNAVGIHLPKLCSDNNYNNYNIYNDNLWFAHFSNWSKSSVRKQFFKDNYILDYHLIYSSSSSKD